MPTAPNNAVFKAMVLGYHRYEVADPVVSSEAGDQGDTDVHHALGFRDHDGASTEPGQPMPLAGVVPLDAVRLVLARIELPQPAGARHRPRNRRRSTGACASAPAAG